MHKRVEIVMSQTRKMYSVMMIDDEIWALRGLMGIIDWNEYGFEIQGSFTDSREALNAILASRPDVVFTDIRMPGIDGVELIKQIREQKLPARIVIVTAYEDFEIARMALKTNVTDYLIKPLDREDVKNAAQSIYEQLAGDTKNVFRLTDYDLSDEGILLLPEVSRHLYSLPLFGMRVVVCDQPVALEGLTPIHIKGYACSYLVPETALDLLAQAQGRKGLSTPIRTSDKLSEHITEAKMSYDGDFRFSENELTAHIQRFLYENMDKKLSLEQIANHFYLSKSYVYELFRNYASTSAMNFLKEVRLTRAASCLLSTKASIQEVAAFVGYDDPGYFSKQFKIKYGCTPEKYAATVKQNHNLEA